jgi:hypothetical protein
MRLTACLGFVVALAGCAAPTTQQTTVDEKVLEREKAHQRELALSDLLRDERRLFDVAWPIMRGAAPLCGEKIVSEMGFRINGKDSVQRRFKDKDWRKAALSAYGIGDYAVVMIVGRNTPAMRAGMAPGDFVVGVEGKLAPTGDDATGKLVDLMRKGASDGRLDLEIERGGRRFSVSISGEPACDYSLHIQHEQDLNAFADGERIFVTTRMIEFARTDDQLAVVVGHELAHNFMKHIQAKMRNRVAAGAVGFAADIFLAVLGVNTQGAFSKETGKLGAEAFSQEFEAEADYAGLYATALGGYDIRVAPDFWRRMGSANTKTIAYGESHPPTAFRSAALEKIVAEIEGKRRAGQPLRPNLKKPEPPAPEPEPTD